MSNRTKPFKGSAEFVVVRPILTQLAANRGRRGVVHSDHGGPHSKFQVLAKLEGENVMYLFDRSELAELPSAPMTRRVLDHLRKMGNVSAVEANDIYRCRSLPRRILDLKDLGWTITKEMKTDVAGQKYARYTLDEQERY